MLRKYFTKRTLPILALVAALSLSGCSTGNANASTTDTTAQTSTTTESSVTEVLSTLEAVTLEDEDKDASYDSATAVQINFKDGVTTLKNDSGVEVSGQIVTITQAGTYVLSGTLEAGQVIVNVNKEEKVHLVLNGVSIQSPDGPAINILQTEKAIVTLADGTVNTLSDSKTYTLAEGEDEPNATIFSKEDLSINGSGTLKITGNYASGIRSKDDLIIASGNITVTAVEDALNGKDAVGIFGGVLDLTAGEDAVHSKTQVWVEAGSIKIAATDDGIHADAALTINGGNINITESYEGLEAANITQNGGTVTLKASDDGLNAAGGNDGSATTQGQGGAPGGSEFSADSPYFIKITGGTLHVNAQGDGLDANGSMYISGGDITVSGPTDDGNGPMDYDGVCEVTGGTFSIAGSSRMAQAPSDTSTQNSILVYFTAGQSAGSEVTLTDAKGTVVASYAPEKAYQSILFGSSKLMTGESYTLKVAGKTLTTIKVASSVTQVSDTGEAVTGGMGGPGGGGGGRGQGRQKPTGTPPATGSN